MVTREQVMDSLKHLKDSILHRSLVELGLIRDIMVKENKVNLTLVLSEEEDNIKAAIEEQVKEALQQLGLDQIHIRFRLMTDFEKSEIAKKTNSAEDHQQNQAHQQHQQVNPQQKTRPQGHMKDAERPTLLQPESNVKFIAVASGKGGVGKSTVTVNLAVALARKGKKVGLVDADIYGFSVPDMMGIEQFPQMENNTIIPVERFGVKVISMGFFVEDNAPIIWRGPMLGKMLKNFFNEVVWGDLDYMLLDLPPGTGDIALDVHGMIPQSKEILVTTPHATAAFVAARAGSMAKHTNHEILGVVENMAYYECGACGNKDYIFGRGGGAKLAEEMKVELLAQIPLGAPDNHPSEAEYSPSVYKAESATGQIYMDMADRIIEKLEG